MAKKKEKLYQGTIPIAFSEWDKCFVLQHFQNSHFQIQPQNFIFKDTFKFKSFSRGRSSAVANYLNETEDLTATMFLSNISDTILGGGDLLNLSGYFTVCKKGANYGLNYLGNTLPEDCGLYFIENHIEHIKNIIGEAK